MPDDTERAGFSLACIGDVMPAATAEELKTLGAEALRNQIWKPVEGVDAILMNLEAPITSNARTHANKRYCFRCSKSVLDLLDGRFIIGLANNHIFDYGEKGLLDTLEALDSRNFTHSGAGRNLRDAGPVVTEIAGVRLGIICAADVRYQAATKTSAGTFPAIPGLLRDSISDLRRRTAVVLVSIHGGQEFLPVPSPQQRRLADLCLDEGARVVSFHHAHCVSGWRWDHRGVTLFGTGNYLFPWGDTPSSYSAFRESAAWRVILDPSRPETERLEIRPILIGEDGLPREASAVDAARILGRIRRYSDRIRAEKLGWWRVREMMRPVYLWMNMTNYADIARRNGIRASLRLLAEGIRTQMTAGRQDEDE